MLGKKKAGGAYKANNYKDHSYVARNTCVTGDINFVGGLHVEGKGLVIHDDAGLGSNLKDYIYEVLLVARGGEDDVLVEVLMGRCGQSQCRVTDAGAVGA